MLSECGVANSPLDNPVWSALHSTHAGLARSHGTACAYPEAISPFMGAAELDAQGWSDLAALESSARLIRSSIGEPPVGSNVMFRAGLRQMIAPTVVDFAQPHSTRELGTADVPAMLKLTERTKPGPFRERTIEFGGYIGIFQVGPDGEDQLVAMAGRRMQSPDFGEVSAVCTDPSFGRRGAAAQLTLTVAAAIQAEGKTALLHVSDLNPTAGRLYEKLNFVVRAHLEVAAVLFIDSQRAT